MYNQDSVRLTFVGVAYGDSYHMGLQEALQLLLSSWGINLLHFHDLLVNLKQEITVSFSHSFDFRFQHGIDLSPHKKLSMKIAII